MLDDIKLLLKVSFPTITIIFLTFLNLFVSKNYFDFGQLFVFQAIFFWLLYTPSLLPIYIILISGIVQDIIFLTPIGTTGLVFLLLIFLFEKYNKLFLEPSFFELTYVFIALFIIGSIIFWGINSLISLEFILININFFYKILLNVLVFPIIYFFLHILLKKLNLEKKF
ncbi:MAG: rod shape-determining protein MreD [Pelagibacteraceae bacterium]|nr:rod shape-determining protein MreD [Pelagibacteraceae bacterium]|tara:strand:- start:4205 stop:4711 length:507 start_codon:yes stop_codon:yes gene_type:complete